MYWCWKKEISRFDVQEVSLIYRRHAATVRAGITCVSHDGVETAFGPDSRG